MRFVVIDSEAPNVHGGGIRTYTQLVACLFQKKNIPVQIYTHNPQAYSDVDTNAKITLIKRQPFLIKPFSTFAYKFFYAENVLFEYANWIYESLVINDTADTVYEFPDFLGYGFFVLKKKSKLKSRVNIRIHTPNYLVQELFLQNKISLNQKIAKFRERFCLKNAHHISAPSAEFVLEKLPKLKFWEYLPNPIPRFTPCEPIDTQQFRFLFLGRIEVRKGILPLLHAFKSYAGKNALPTLTIVGTKPKGGYSKKVEAFLNKLPNGLKTRMNWQPPCTEAERQQLLTQFDFVIVPSLWENSPYVYFEAMSAGLVCLGSNTGEMKKIAQFTNAPSFKPGSELAISQTLMQTENLNRKQIIATQFTYLNQIQKNLPNQFELYFKDFITK